MLDLRFPLLFKVAKLCEVNKSPSYKSTQSTMTLKTEIPKIDLFTDGGADPNPGRGGYGIILSWKGHRKEFHEGFVLTTNNRMELMAVIKGLEKLKGKSEVRVFSDSKYLIDGIEKGWAKKWKANNWFRTKNEKALNADLWDRLLGHVEHHEVKFHWVKGHDGHPENERCDALATLAMQLKNLTEDVGFIHKENITNLVDKETLSGTSNKPKIQKEGDLCRKCNTPLVIKTPEKRKVKEHQEYYFAYYLYCPSCQTLYHLEEAKRTIENNPSLFD